MDQAKHPLLHQDLALVTAACMAKYMHIPYSREVREPSTATSEPVYKMTFRHLKKHLPYTTLGERIIYVISYP